MAAAQEQEQQRPHKPARSEVDETHAGPEAEARHDRGLLPQHGIDDVAAVELADGEEVEAGQDQAEPAGKAEAANREGRSRRGAGPRNRRAIPWRRRGSPSVTPVPGSKAALGT